MPELEHLPLRCSRAWRGAGREPGVTPGSSAGTASRDSSLPEMRVKDLQDSGLPYVGHTNSPLLLRAETQSPWACSRQPWGCPRPSAPLPQKLQEVGAAGGCRSRRRGACHLVGVCVGAAVFRACWLRLCFSACNPSGQINHFRW